MGRLGHPEKCPCPYCERDMFRAWWNEAEDRVERWSKRIKVLEAQLEAIRSIIK